MVLESDLGVILLHAQKKAALCVDCITESVCVFYI